MATFPLRETLNVFSLGKSVLAPVWQITYVVVKLDTVQGMSSIKIVKSPRFSPVKVRVSPPKVVPAFLSRSVITGVAVLL